MESLEQFKLVFPSFYLGFPDSSAGKESNCNAGNPGSIPGSGRSPAEGIGYTLQYSCLENPRGQMSLVGYSPWGHKESDKTEATYQQQQLIKNVFVFVFFPF